MWHNRAGAHLQSCSGWQLGTSHGERAARRDDRDSWGRRGATEVRHGRGSLGGEGRGRSGGNERGEGLGRSGGDGRQMELPVDGAADRIAGQEEP